MYTRTVVRGERLGKHLKSTHQSLLTDGGHDVDFEVLPSLVPDQIKWEVTETSYTVSVTIRVSSGSHLHDTYSPKGSVDLQGAKGGGVG